MLAIQPGRGFQRDEELRSIGIRSRVCHGHYSSAGMLEIARYFVWKLSAVYRFSTPSRPSRIASLDHEIPYNAMEYGAVVIASVCQSRHVVAGSWCMLVVEFNHKRALQLQYIYIHIVLAICKNVSELVSVFILLELVNNSKDNNNNNNKGNSHLHGSYDTGIKLYVRPRGRSVGSGRHGLVFVFVFIFLVQFVRTIRFGFIFFAKLKTEGEPSILDRLAVGPLKEYGLLFEDEQVCHPSLFPPEKEDTALYTRIAPLLSHCTQYQTKSSVVQCSPVQL